MRYYDKRYCFQVLRVPEMRSVTRGREKALSPRQYEIEYGMQWTFS